MSAPSRTAPGTGAGSPTAPWPRRETSCGASRPRCAGTYHRPTAITVDEACDEWLAGRRGIRRVTIYSYEMDLKPVRRYLGGKKLQAAHQGRRRRPGAVDADRGAHLAAPLPGRLAGGPRGHAGVRTPRGHHRRRARRRVPGGDVHSALSALLATGRVTRLRRGVYAPAEPETSAAAAAEKRGLSPQTVRSTLTTFGAVVQSYVDQGVLPRNVIALVERPKDADPDDAEAPTEAPPAPSPRPSRGRWPRSASFASRCAITGCSRAGCCPATGCAGPKCSACVGARSISTPARCRSGGAGSPWAVRRSRVRPSRRRSRRDLPLPADVTEALRALRQRQQARGPGARSRVVR